jgi:tetratricopeptide (TPR) repeat protein
LTDIVNLAAANDSLLVAMADSLPVDRRIALDEGAAVLAERALPIRLQTISDPVRRANEYSRLGNRLSYIGRDGDALKAYNSALDIVIADSTDSESAHRSLSALGGILINISTTMANLELPYEASDIAALAVATITPFADRSEEFKAAYAFALNMYGNRLAEVSRFDESLAVTEESVRIIRGIRTLDPARIGADLGTALNNLANKLSNVGRTDDALSVAREAVEIERATVSSDPLLRDHGLLIALIGLSSRLRDSGQSREAVDPAAEALELARALAAAAQEAFGLDLLRALVNFSSVLLDVGRPVEAEDAAREAAELSDGVAPASGSTARELKASALLVMASAYFQMRRHEECISFGKVGLEIREDLARGGILKYERAFLAALQSFGQWTAEGGEYQRALDSSARQLDLARTIYLKTGSGINDVASALNDRGNFLSQAGFRHDAFRMSSEAVFYWRTAAFEQGRTFRMQLAVSLGNLAMRALAVNEFEVASSRQHEALDILVAEFVGGSSDAEQKLYVAVKNAVYGARYFPKVLGPSIADHGISAAMALLAAHGPALIPVIAHLLAQQGASLLLLGVDPAIVQDIAMNSVSLVLTFRSALPNVFSGDLFDAILWTSRLVVILDFPGAWVLDFFLHREVVRFLNSIGLVAPVNSVVPK